MPFWKRKAKPPPIAMHVTPSRERLEIINDRLKVLQDRMQTERDNIDLWVESGALFNERDILQWRQSGVAVGYTVSIAEDACEACKRQPRRVYSLDEPCPLPCPDCSNDVYGFCRCGLRVVLDDDFDW